MMTVKHIAALLEGDVIGDPDIEVTGVAKIEEAKQGFLSFIANPKYEKYIESTAASVVLVSRNFDRAKHKKLPPALILLDDPYSSFVVAISQFLPPKENLEKGIHPTAVIHPSVSMGNGCSVGAYVVIGEGVSVGNGSRLHSHTVIGRDVTIGDDCELFPNVTVREGTVIGSRVNIQPGAVIGSDGFGFAPKKDRSYKKIPQLGIVVIEDDVEIQANACIDRATLGETRIKKGVKIDNLVQIAHNVIVGEDTVIAGGTMVAGSTKIGKNNMIGGNVSITGHIFTEDDVRIGGHSGVSGQLDVKGETYMGYPAKEARKWRRMEGGLRQLPELLVEIREMKQRIAELEEKLKKMKP